VTTLVYTRAGFATWVVQALNALGHVKEQNYVPYIDWGITDGTAGGSSERPEAQTNIFYDEAVGKNVWEYFFEPVSEWNPACPGEVSDQHMGQFEDWCRWIETYYTPAAQHDPRVYEHAWYTDQRTRAAALVKEYLRPKAHLVSKVAAEWQKVQSEPDQKIIGVHIRGTDLEPSFMDQVTYRKLALRHYSPFIDRYLEFYPGSRVFLATDDYTYVADFKEKYGPKLLYTREVMRSGSKRSLSGEHRLGMAGLAGNVFHQLPCGTPGAENVNGKNFSWGCLDPEIVKKYKSMPYSKAEEVMVDIMLLAKCDAMLSQESSVSEMAIYMNPALQETSFHVQYEKNDHMPAWAKGVKIGRHLQKNE
jgi:hypothetical protein